MSLFGVDVSTWQGDIDWKKAKDSIDFAILRLGWIGNRNNHALDNKFERNYRECVKLGIPVGIYIYSYSKTEAAAISGAEWVLKTLKKRKLDLPIYLDMEDKTIKSAGRVKLTKICHAFNTKIEQGGYWAGVYANADWFKNYLNGEELRKRYTCWIAHYTKGTDKYKGVYDIWQYSSSGTVPGIKGRVDTNYMYRDLIKEVSNTVDKVVEKYITYKIKYGDTLSGIAKMYNTTYKNLAKINNIKDPNKIYTGKVIKVPVK